MGMKYFVFSKREQWSIIQSQPVVELLVHHFCFQSNDKLLLLLFLLIEVKLLALALLNKLMNGIMALASRGDWHPLRVRELLIVLDKCLCVPFLDLRNEPTTSQILIGDVYAHEDRWVVYFHPDHFRDCTRDVEDVLL